VVFRPPLTAELDDDDSARHRRNVRVIEALHTGSYAAVARRFPLGTRTLVRLGKRVSV
jgi:hypothetical protein